MQDRIASWIKENRRLFYISAGIGLGMLVLFGTLWGYWEYQRQRGLNELRKGLMMLEAGNFETAVIHLSNARHKVSGEARELVLLSLGDAYRRQEKLDLAQEAYTVLAREGEKKSYLTQLAFLELGYLTERQNDLKRARELYEKAAAIEGPFGADATLAVARVLENLGDQKAASSQYEQFLGIYGSSALAEIVRQKEGK